jgi:hypothetical protein
MLSPFNSIADILVNGCLGPIVIGIPPNIVRLADMLRIALPDPKSFGSACVYLCITWLGLKQGEVLVKEIHLRHAFKWIVV